MRQLYFLLGGLLDRLVYLSYGLAAVLGFIGVKLVLDALHGNNVSFLNGGEPVEWAPHIAIWLSLAVIVCALGVATIASAAGRGGTPGAFAFGLRRRPNSSSRDLAASRSWWVVYERGWLRITDELTATDIDQRAAQVPEADSSGV